MRILNYSPIKSLLLVFSIVFFGETTVGQTLDQLTVKQVKGKYDQKTKTFYARSLDANEQSIEHEYVAKDFKGKISPVVYSCTDKRNGGRQFSFEGVIDSSGNILLPCVYDETKIFFDYSNYSAQNVIVNESVFSALKDGKYILLDRNNKVLYSMPTRSDLADDYSAHWNNYFRSGVDPIQKNLNYAVVKRNEKVGLFSFIQAKEIISPKFDDIAIYDGVAICTIGDSAVAFDCLKGNYSVYYQEITRKESGEFLVLGRNNGLQLLENIFDPKSIPADKPYVQIIEHNKSVQIVRSADGKVGVIDKNDKLIIPMQYEDIYFFGETLLLLKKYGLWAASTYDHILKSEFEFEDVEQQNLVNFKNFIHYTQTDTTTLSAEISKHTNENRMFPYPNDDMYTQMLDETGKLMKELNKHVLSEYSHYVLKKSDGYCLIEIKSYDTSVSINPLSWDNIFVIPQISSAAYNPQLIIGVQKGDKFGYISRNRDEELSIIYENIRFDPLIYRSYNKNKYSYKHNPFLIVKKGVAYYEMSKWIPFDNRDEKTKWVKWGDDVRKF
jgi:hypothetical protein